MGIFGRSRRRHRVEILGAPSVGKTTLIYRLARQPVPEAMMPTAVAVLEKTVESQDGHMFVFSEQKKESPGASAIIYVLDCTRLEAGVEDLKRLVSEGQHPASPLLVIVNKKDLVSNENLDTVAEGLAPIVGIERSWAVLDCSAQNNTGILEVEQWLETKLKI